MEGQTKTKKRVSPELTKKQKKVYWYIWNLISIALISIIAIWANCQTSITSVALAFSIPAFMTFAIIYLFIGLDLFEYTSSISVVILYDLLWSASLKIGLNIYSVFLNVAIGIVLAILLWVFYDNIMPLKGVWNKKLVTEKMKIKGAPFFYLTLTFLFAIIVIPAMLFWNYSFINFVLMVFVLTFLIYFTLDFWVEAKKYVEKEKGEKHGKPKPKPE